MERSPKDSRRFATTRWSLIIAAGRPDASERGAAALATLCETYWFPVYAFIRRSGASSEDARDLAQAFFTRMIEKNDFGAADPARGRFRSFLLAAVRHFLANQRDAALAQKRGGGSVHVPIEADEYERRYAHEPADPETPERVFERRWALAVIDAAIERLALRYADPDRRRVFDKLRPCLAAGEPPSYAELAADLGTTEGALRVALHRMRTTFREVLREVIIDTVHDPADVDDELRYLLAALAR